MQERFTVIPHVVWDQLHPSLRGELLIPQVLLK